MEPLCAPASLAHFQRVIRSCPNTQAMTLLVQRINQWLRYYPYLHTVLGGFSPVMVVFIHQHFYTFATLILHGIAVTFYYFFALPRPEEALSHTHLTREFPRLCAVYGFQGDTEDLAARMRDLDVRIIARNADVAQGVTTSAQETLRDVVIRLDQYIVAMLAMWEANLEQSVCGSHHPTQET